jgi:hypothetical protein
MKTELYLQIPKPCHENWDAMTSVDKGRFCTSCSKEVVDFSLLSDVEVLNFFNKSTGNTCGRFSHDQLQRPLQETKIQKRKGWKWVMASVTSLIMISRSNAQKKEDCIAIVGKVKVEQPKKPVAKEKVLTKPIDNKVIPPIIALEQITLGDVEIISSGRKIEIKGIVVDEKNAPVAGAIIHAGNEGIIGLTDGKGRFNVTTNTRGNKLPVTFKSIGFFDDNAVIDLLEDEVELRVIMKPKTQVLPEVTVTSFQPIRCLAVAGGVSSYVKVSKKDTPSAFIRKMLDLVPVPKLSNPLKIYPNPAFKNSVVHLSIKDAGNYQVQLFDNVSRLLEAQENITTVKQQSIDLQLPPVLASGMYYIRLINMQTKKSYVDKLIVQ